MHSNKSVITEVTNFILIVC